jgi:fluoride ion exporter CrcB/FEX
MIAIGWIVLFIIIIISTSLKICNEKLSILKYVSLILLPSILVGIGAYILSLYSYFFGGIQYKNFPSLIVMALPAIYGLIIMLPSLMLYAVHTLSLEKNFSLSKWKLFMWAGFLGGVSTLPYLSIMPFEFIMIPIVTGSLAMMIVYYISKRRER